jgi:hypothetical protein
MQEHVDSELIIVSQYWPQTLIYDHPRIRIYNPKEMHVPGKLKNWAVDQARGEVIIAWDEMSVYLPGFLTQIEKSIEGRDWCWLEKELCLDRQLNVHTVQGSEFSFAFRKSVWAKCGQYGPGIGRSSNRNLIGTITKLVPGEPTLVQPDNINVIQMGTPEEREGTNRLNVVGKIKLIPALARDYYALTRATNGKRESRLCVVELGRYGDIINLLPVLKIIAEQYGPPHLMVSQQFADLLDGVSYVKPFPTTLKNEKLGAAISLAQQDFQIVINAQIWGEGWQQKKVTPSYNRESWNNAGFTHRFDDESLRPVFDRRDPVREAALTAALRGDDARPMMLVNVTKAISSPCPECGLVLAEIVKVWGGDYNVVDLSLHRAERVYDFLDALERAACIVSIDTVWLHLATATKCPVVALVNPKGEGWASTAVRCGNAVAHIPYNKVMENACQHLHEAIAAAIQRPGGPVAAPAGPIPLVRRVWHAVERHEYAQPDKRVMAAWASWDTLYADGSLLPSHLWNYPRSAKSIGDTRDLPYLKDVLLHAMNQAADADIIMWTNDDNLLHGEVADYVKFHVSVFGPCTSFRSEFRGLVPSLRLPPRQWDFGTSKHMGRDLFAATKEWLVRHWGELPDFLIGCSDFDLCLATWVRNQYGYTTTNQNIAEAKFPADAVRGHIGHQYHNSHWSRPDYGNVSAGQKHNRRLFREWAAKYCHTLTFNENNTLK